MGQGLSVDNVAKAADFALEELNSKSSIGKFFSGLTAPSICKSDGNNMDDYMRCNIASSQRDAWEIIFVCAAIFILFIVIMMIFCAFKIRSCARRSSTNNTNINLNTLLSRQSVQPDQVLHTIIPILEDIKKMQAAGSPRSNLRVLPSVNDYV